MENMVLYGSFLKDKKSVDGRGLSGRSSTICLFTQQDEMVMLHSDSHRTFVAHCDISQRYKDSLCLVVYKSHLL